MHRFPWFALLLCASLFALDWMAHLAAEAWWFVQLDYGAVYWTQILGRSLLGLLGGGLSAMVLFGNLRLIQRGSLQSSPVGAHQRLGLGQLLGTLGIGYAGLLGLLWWQGTVVVQLWKHTDPYLPMALVQLPQLTWIDLKSLGGLRSQGIPGLGLGLAAAIALFWGWRHSTRAIALLTCLSLGFTLSTHWPLVLAGLHPTAFGSQDPVFGLDLGFYVFIVPLLELIRFWGTQVVLVALLSALVIYLRSGDSLSNGYFAGFTTYQSRHLHGLLSLMLLGMAYGFWLERYTLLYSPQGAIVGAGFTDLHGELPAKIALSLGALILSVVCLTRTLKPSPTIKVPVRTIPLLVGYGVAIWLGTLGLPTLIQIALVQPNELTRERPYITQSLRFTRQAFGLDRIEVKTFDPKGKLTPAILQENQSTLRNIRLWDTNPLLEANQQLQRIRPYYEFPDAHIDRYSIQAAKPKDPPESRQVLIAGRELDYSTVPSKAKTWLNQRLVYTHGYGFTVSPVNTAAPSGLPEYWVKDIGTATDASGLQAVNPQVTASIATAQPRIYFGKLTYSHIMTHTTVPELDYPKGDDNAYSTYHGEDGIAIDTFWKRGLLALYLRDWQMLLTQNFTPQTRVLFRRQVLERVQAIAPFLQFDHNPYLVAVPQDSSGSGTLRWILDAYTVSNRYPYSDPGGQPFNYIRNSVKVVVDAYSGRVTFYAVDLQEPILATWRKVFPHVFLPLSEMPEALHSHIRYPIDFFQAQSKSLLNYHMNDPQVFYNREDPWRVPNEIYGKTQQPVEPYYLIMKLPEGESEEFVLLYPFTPMGRNNLIAWLAARSDGENYGKQLLYQFPKGELVYGPEQIEALINQDPIISQQISLWNRQGSRVLQGNLLIIPIAQALLYVEPLYIEAEVNSVPALARVVVVYQDRVVMAKTLEEGLTKLFPA